MTITFFVVVPWRSDLSPSFRNGDTRAFIPHRPEELLLVSARERVNRFSLAASTSIQRLFTKFTIPLVIPPQLRAHFLWPIVEGKKIAGENCKRFICNNVWCTISCRNIYVLLCGPVLCCPAAGILDSRIDRFVDRSLFVADNDPCCCVQLFNRKNKENGGTQLARMNAIYGPATELLFVSPGHSGPDHIFWRVKYWWFCSWEECGVSDLLWKMVGFLFLFFGKLLL